MEFKLGFKDTEKKKSEMNQEQSELYQAVGLGAVGSRDRVKQNTLSSCTKSSIQTKV